ECGTHFTPRCRRGVKRVPFRCRRWSAAGVLELLVAAGGCVEFGQRLALRLEVAFLLRGAELLQCGLDVLDDRVHLLVAGASAVLAVGVTGAGRLLVVGLVVAVLLVVALAA